MRTIYSQLVKDVGGFQVSDTALFIAQLYCWAKLSSVYREEVVPNFFDVALCNHSNEEVQSILLALQDLEVPMSMLEDLRALDRTEKRFKALVQQAMHLRVFRFSPLFLNGEGLDFAKVLAGVEADVSSNSDCFKDVASDLIEILAQSGTAFQYTLPDELLSLMVSLGELSDQSRVACTGEMSLPIALKASKVSKRVSNLIYMPTGSGSLRTPYHVINLLVGSPVLIENMATPLSIQQDDYHYDIGFSALPFGVGGRAVDKAWAKLTDINGKPLMQARNVEQQELAELLSITSQKSVVLVPDAFLYATIGDQATYRKELISSGHVHSIISLPSGILGETSIKTALIIIDKSEELKSVHFIDASGNSFYRLATGARNRHGGRNVLTGIDSIVDCFLSKPETGNHFSRQVSIDEIARNNFDLMTSRYVVDDKVDGMQRKLASMDTVALEDICDVISVSPVKSKAESEGELFQEIRIGDINDQGSINEELGQIRVDEKKIAVAHKLMLRSNDVLLSVKGSIGTVALVQLEQHEGALPSQTLCIIRKKAGYDYHRPLEIFRYLKSPLAQMWLQQRAKGNNVRSISIKELKELPVPKISPQERMDIASAQKEIGQLTQEIDALKKKRAALEASLWSTDEYKL
ncbi:hypothetical protein BIW16_09240 [Vibrio sp. OULL4]|nr:hypothetical protein BIW16_09240 [Vibrio sp. OULL4]